MHPRIPGRGGPDVFGIQSRLERCFETSNLIIPEGERIAPARLCWVPIDRGRRVLLLLLI